MVSGAIVELVQGLIAQISAVRDLTEETGGQRGGAESMTSRTALGKGVRTRQVTPKLSICAVADASTRRELGETAEAACKPRASSNEAHCCEQMRSLALGLRVTAESEEVRTWLI